MPHAVAEKKAQFSDLPRELVEEILSHVPTKSLVVASVASKFIHNVATYLVHRRIKQLLETENYRLIYECYIPSEKFNHPYNHCEYVGTFVDHHPGDTPKAAVLKQSTQAHFSPVPKLYTHFLPTLYDHTSPSASQSSSHTKASTTVALDSGEIFTQVCAQACLVKVGPKRGLFESVIPIFESFFRVRRGWLDDCCEKGEEGGKEVMWVGMNENVGLRLKVGEKNVIGGGKYDEDAAVEYGIQYQELTIRTAYLLDMIEKRRSFSYFQNVSIVPASYVLPVREVLVY